MNNIKPLERQQRDQLLNKDIIEKTYINNRLGFETRFTDAKKLIYQSDLTSSLHCNDNDRFDKDFANFDKTNRENRINRIQNKNEINRLECFNRDKKRWDNYDNLDQLESNRMKNKSERVFQGKRNINYQGFNTINNRYENTSQGKQLYDKEQSLQIKYLVRQTNLQQKNNQNFNIITGDYRKSQNISADILDKYNEGIQKQNQFYDSLKSSRIQ